MKKTICILTTITFIILLFTSCHKDKCKSENLGTVKFSTEDLQIVPYKGTETLTFSDSLGNILIFNGIGKSFNFNKFYEDPLNSDCKGDYFYSDHNYFEYKGDKTLLIIELYINDGSSFHQNIKKIINISCSYEKTKIWDFNCSFYFDNKKLYSSTNNAESKVTFLDSLNIGIKKYFSIYILEQIKKPYTSENLQYIYYTINDGLIRFKTIDGNIWNLK